MCRVTYRFNINEKVKNKTGIEIVCAKSSRSIVTAYQGFKKDTNEKIHGLINIKTHIMSIYDNRNHLKEVRQF